MASVLRRPKAAGNGSQPRRARRGQPRRDIDLEGLTAGALYDLQLHGALTAAAVDVHAKNAQDIRRLIQPWQARAISYYDLVPEVKFAANFMAQMLRRVRLFPAMLDPTTQEPEELTSGPVFDEFARIQDRGGGRAELQGSYAKLKFLIGETYLTVSPDEDRGEVWECLSPNELRVQPGGLATRFRAPMLAADQYLIGQNDYGRTNYVVGNDRETVNEYGEVLGPQFRDHGPDVIAVYRLWRPSPAYSWLADCNMQSSLDILEELVLSTYSVRAQLKSRLNQGGLLLMPDEISFTALGNDPEEDPTSDEFQERLTTAIMASISDPGTAAAFSPIVARIAGEFIKDVKLVKFNDTAGELAEINQRTEMVERFGIGAELPPELFKSQADLNHWTGWLIDEQTWKSYGHPAALEMAGDFCSAVLQPSARDAGAKDWQDIRVGIDASEVINHPDRAKDADALYQGRAISKKVWRESKGYNDNDAMPEDELNEMLGAQIRDGSLAKYGIPQVRGGAIEPAAGEIESPAGQSTEAPGTPVSGADTEKGPPATGPGSKESQAGPALQASAANREQQILGAAEFAVQRGRELAGSRLRAMTSARGPKEKRCAECQEAIDGLPNWDVAATLGETQVAAVGGNGGLVDGTGQAFASVLERMGVSSGWATELGDLVEQHTARTLYQPVPEGLPAGFAVLLRRIDLPLERT
jgi:hypothetical protein